MKQAWRLVGPERMIPLREGKKIRFEGLEVALFNLGGEFLAVDNRCPHKAGPLADGIVAGRSVFCPLHNWKIDLQKGCAVAGGEGSVKTYPVKVQDGNIYIAFETSDAEAAAR
jgi:nitrite reductase (NADH) small subunit